TVEDRATGAKFVLALGESVDIADKLKPQAKAGDDDANFKPQFSDAVPQPPATKPANGPRVLIVGGGSSHDFVKFFGGTDKATLGAYTVKITTAAPPITKGVPASFEITDELYNYTADPAGNAVEVLAEATSPKTGKTFPQVFIVKHAKARIVGFTLGHDARAH